jgi:hypothetical protein
MAIPFATPSRVFKSRASAKAFIRDEIVRKYPLRTPIPRGAHHDFLTEVLTLHPEAQEKIGSGVDYFYIEETWRLPGKESVSRDQRAIVLVRTDGGKCDWSYVYVVDQPATAANVKSALHFALDEGRRERRDSDFASGEPVTCALTGEVIAQKHQADTRHLSPTWDELTTGFADEHGGWDKIKTHSGKDGIFRWA